MKRSLWNGTKLRFHIVGENAKVENLPKRNFQKFSNKNLILFIKTFLPPNDPLITFGHAKGTLSTLIFANIKFRVH